MWPRSMLKQGYNYIPMKEDFLNTETGFLKCVISHEEVQVLEMIT